MGTGQCPEAIMGWKPTEDWKLFDVFKIGAVGGLGFAAGNLIYKMFWVLIVTIVEANGVK